MRGQCVFHEKSDFDELWHNINLAAGSSTNVLYIYRLLLAFLRLFFEIRFEITGMLYLIYPPCHTGIVICSRDYDYPCRLVGAASN